MYSETLWNWWRLKISFMRFLIVKNHKETIHDMLLEPNPAIIIEHRSVCMTIQIRTIRKRAPNLFLAAMMQ